MVILIYGEDAFRVHEKVNGMVSKFKDKFDESGMNVDIFEYKENDGEIMSAVGAPPFLSDRRMIVIHGLAKSITKKADAKTWAKRLLDRGDDTIVILVDDELTLERSTKNKLYAELKDATDVHSYALGVMTSREAEAWVTSHVSVVWDANAVSEIVERVGGDTWRLKNECDKVSSACVDDSVTRDLVCSLVAPSFNDTLFAFLDAVRAANGKRAVALLRNEIDRGTAPGQLINMLIKEVQLLVELRSYAAVNGRGSERDAARELGMHPFVAKKTMPRALSIGSDELQTMITAVMTADQRLKGGSMKDNAILEQLVVDLII